MYDPLTPWMAETHRNELLSKAKENRMLKAESSRFGERLFVRVGDILISTGLRLHQLYQPTTTTKVVTTN
jgi:hypothetical protein